MRKAFMTFVCVMGITTLAAQSTVYFTADISAEGLMKVYEALGRKPAEGDRVAVKISTGEPGGKNFLQPSLIKDLVQSVDGTIVECNTAYQGRRSGTAAHKQAARDHGFYDIANVDIMDEEGEMEIPVQDTKHMKHNIVGTHLSNYDFMINLAHFKGHAIGGFGGVIKNASIGVASRNGKAYIHSAGRTTSPSAMWGLMDNQDGFLECMAAATQAVHNYFSNGEKILYINVMNNLSVDCDCSSNPAAPQMKDVGILASLDPIALDKACLDIVFNHTNTTGDTSAPLAQRINRQHGTWAVEYGEKIGLGSQSYELIDIDNTNGIANAEGQPVYNVYTMDGVKVRDRAVTLAGLEKGTYIINGVKKQLD
ncbi:MAG: DUF362 domain-containing protein [Prevotella sp.]|nr:DUF362 domain-containing protein [Prevotella sp.]